jgi:hypothetical protein
MYVGMLAFKPVILKSRGLSGRRDPVCLTSYNTNNGLKFAFKSNPTRESQ